MTFQLLISVMIGWFSGLKKEKTHFILEDFKTQDICFSRTQNMTILLFFTEKWSFMINDRAYRSLFSSRMYALCFKIFAILKH